VLIKERLALGHGENQGREPVVLAGELGNDRVDIASIGSFKPATKRERQELLGQAPSKRTRARLQSRLELRRPRKMPTARQLAPGVNRLTSFVQSPVADGIEVLESEPEGIHAPVAGGTRRVGPVP
jgi:hypothetical protein